MNSLETPFTRCTRRRERLTRKLIPVSRFGPKSIQVTIAIIKRSKLKDLTTHADNIASASGSMLPLQIAESTVSNTLEAALNVKVSQLALRDHSTEKRNNRDQHSFFTWAEPRS